MAVDKHGKEKIDDEVAYFRNRAKSDPQLFQKLYSTPHPYQWMIDDNATSAAARGNRHRSDQSISGPGSWPRNVLNRERENPSGSADILLATRMP